MSKPTYSELLKDPRWQRRRLEILSRAAFACENCDSREKTLHVHHRLYYKGRLPWEYEDHELQALCEDCHTEEHSIRSRLNAALALLPVGEIEMILGYAEGKFAISNWKTLDKQPIKVTSYEHASGMLDALWNWNTGAGKADPCCLIDHGEITDLLVCAVGEGEMPLPSRK